MITRTHPGSRAATRAAAHAATALACASALLLAGCGGGDADTDAAAASMAAAAGSATPASPAPSSPTDERAGHEGAVTEITVTVAGGQVQGPGDRVEVPLGSVVHLTVTSDTADEVHVHGYDETVELVPGTPAAAEFPADIPGVFEVELHESGLLLVSLQVQ